VSPNHATTTQELTAHTYAGNYIHSHHLRRAIVSNSDYAPKVYLSRKTEQNNEKH